MSDVTEISEAWDRVTKAKTKALNVPLAEQAFARKLCMIHAMEFAGKHKCGIPAMRSERIDFAKYDGTKDGGQS